MALQNVGNGPPSTLNPELTAVYGLPESWGIGDVLQDVIAAPNDELMTLQDELRARQATPEQVAVIDLTAEQGAIVTRLEAQLALPDHDDGGVNPRGASKDKGFSHGSRGRVPHWRK